MASQGRFNIFVDENQPAAADTRKRKVLGVLSTTNGVVLRPSSGNDLKCEIPRQELANKNFVKPENAQKPPQFTTANQKPGDRQPAGKINKHVEELQVVPEKSDDLCSPSHSNSPMLVSPLPTTSADTSRASLVRHRLYDDDFFTKQYGESHFKHLRTIENKIRPRADYMSRQRDISTEMRTVLVDWLVEVNEEYQQSDETLFLTVSLLDRFLSIMSVVRSKLQLVGTAALLVAAKVEEIYPPQIADLVYITDDTYNITQILRMETLLLKTLGFEIGDAHSLKFVRLLAVKAQTTEKIAHMAQYICELSLLSTETLSFLPSEVGAAALLVALHHIGGGEISDQVKETLKFAELDKLQQAADYLHKILLESSAPNFKHRAILNKYLELKRYSSVSMLPLKPSVPIVKDLLG